MKIRDLLVILFTAAVALLLFVRAARADALRRDGAPGSEPGPSKLGRAIPSDLQHAGADEERPPLSNDGAGDTAPQQSLSRAASPGAATATLLNSLAAFLTVGLVARRPRR